MLPRKGNLLFIALICTSAGLTAQNTVGNEEVIVVKEYEATIQDAQRVMLQPSIPETETKTPVFEYQLPPAVLKNFAFEPNPLKPIALGKEKPEKHNQSYILGGIGWHLNPLVQLVYNGRSTDKVRYGLHYRHYNMYSYRNRLQRFSDDAAGAYAEYFIKKSEIGASFNFQNYRTHFYGLRTDTLAPDSVIKPKDARQVFRNYDGQVYFQNAQPNRAEIDYRQQVQFNYLQEIYGKATEWFVAGNTDFGKKFMKHHRAGAHFDFDISLLKYDTFRLARNIFRFAAGYGFDNDDWEARAQIGMAVFGKKVFPLADIHLEKRLYEHSIVAYLSYRLRYEKNSLWRFAETNRFVYHNVPLINSSAGDFGTGLKGTAGKLTYDAAFHLLHVRQLPLFVNDTNDYSRFTVTYDSNSVIYNGHLEAGYQAKEWLRLSLAADYYHFVLRNQPHAWHEPNLRITLRTNYVWKNKISVSLDVYGLSSSKALLRNDSTATIRGLADINLSAWYRMNKHLSFFLQLNNIGHFRYQRWYGYPSFGINGVAGVRFSF
ncbi:MAG: hypothetical protein NZM35_07950 [Chitinophagales bacterium]|nr:hypothetical protein [Chitinophagales bacterium]MDW8419137.1 TonB-dependent receptor [Chitinophagales bacterium]